MPAGARGERSVPGVLWPAQADDRARSRSWSRSDRSAGCWCHSACTFARAAVAARNRTAVLPGALAALRSGAKVRALRAARTPVAVEKRAERVPAARVPRRAQGHAAAWAQLPPLRRKPSDSRSPDRTSATPGSLCRSGYTSPKIAQSLVPVSITSNWARSASEEPSKTSTGLATSGPTGRAARASARSRSCAPRQNRGVGPGPPGRCCPSTCA